MEGNITPYKMQPLSKLGKLISVTSLNLQLGQSLVA
jgi:hypothetical protein